MMAAVVCRRLSLPTKKARPLMFRGRAFARGTTSVESLLRRRWAHTMPDACDAGRMRCAPTLLTIPLVADNGAGDKNHFADPAHRVHFAIYLRMFACTCRELSGFAKGGYCAGSLPM